MTVALWFCALALIPFLALIAAAKTVSRPITVSARSEVHEALLAAVHDWLTQEPIRQALVHEGFERDTRALEGLRHSLGDLNYSGLLNVTRTILEHRYVRHLIARRLMSLSKCSQAEAKAALRGLGQIEME